MNPRYLALIVTVSACASEPKRPSTDPDRPDPSKSLPVRELLGRTTTSPAFLAIEPELQRSTIAYGADDRGWTITGKDFQCELIGTRAVSMGLPPSDGYLVWKVRCTKATPAAGVAVYGGMLPYALDWTTSAVDFSRTIAMYGHPADTKGRLFWQGKRENDPSFMGRPLPGVDAFELVYKYSVLSARPAAPAPPESPGADYLAHHEKMKANLRDKGYRPIATEVHAVVPAAGTNRASMRITRPVVAGRRYALLTWARFASGPAVSVRTSPSLIEAAKLAPHGAAPLSGIELGIFFRGESTDIQVDLTALEASVHTRFFLYWYEAP